MNERPDVARLVAQYEAELAQVRRERRRYRLAWLLARTRALDFRHQLHQARCP